jgi:hypothetical protein
MNKTLALYFDDHFVIGAVEPFEGKFTLLEKNNRQKFFLYFYIDNHQIDYGESYQFDVNREDPRLIQDFYHRICQADLTFDFQGYEHNYVALLNPIVEDIQDSYEKTLGRFTDTTTGIVADSIPVNLGFSPNLTPEAVSAIKGYLESMRFSFTSEAPMATSVDELLLYTMIDRRELIPGNYAIVEGLNDDLNVSLMNVNATMKLKRIAQGAYPGYGTDPRIGVISKYIVDKANENIHILQTEKDRNREYRAKFRDSITWNEQLLKSRRPYIHVSVSLSGMPGMESKIPIQKREIDSLTKARSLQVARFVEHTLEGHANMNSLTRIIVVGDSLTNSQVLDGFYQFGKEKLMVLGNDKVIDIVKGLLIQKTASPLQDLPPEVDQVIPDRFPLKSVRVFDLEPGDKLEFAWDPNREVTAEYKGNGSFMIVSHLNSSVVTGDTFITDQITVGQRAYLRNVIRTTSGKVLGNYKSGVILSLFKS